MITPARVVLRVGSVTIIGAVLLSCGPGPKSKPVACVPAPPGPAELGPATGLSTPPAGAVVFDLRYLAQTGGADDIAYHSFWGYGVSSEEAQKDPFLEDVRKRNVRLHYTKNFCFKGREWAAVEHEGNQPRALYFDLNADGKFNENERILPTKNADNGVDFITPDFINTLEDGTKVLCRALLRVDFYEGNSEPNCMWSPAALLEGTAQLDGKPARLLLFANQPGGVFDKFGSCNFALRLGDDATGTQNEYIPRETLSTLIATEGKFYHLAVEGRRTNGLPARVVLVEDDSPKGKLAIKLEASDTLQVTADSIYLRGSDDATVHLRCSPSKGPIALPVGSYSLTSGSLKYGSDSDAPWELWFREGPCAALKEGEQTLVTLGKPKLKVRAIDEKERYTSAARECATFKKGTKIYLEPRIAGNGKEMYTHFRQRTDERNGWADRPPQVTITGPGGKQVLSAKMEYG